MAATTPPATVPVQRPRRLRLPLGAGAVWAFSAVLAAAAVATWLVLVDLPAPDRGVGLTWWALAIGFALTELCVVHIHLRRSAHSLTLGEIPLVLGLVFAPPADVAVGWVLGAGLVLLLNRGRPVRVAFNLAQFALTASLAASAFHLAGGADAAGPALWLAVTAAVVTSAVVAPVLITVAMRLSAERVGLTALAGMLAPALVVAATNMSLGLALVTVVDADPRGAVLLLAPVGAIFLAYRAYLSEHTKTVGLEFLYATAHALAGAADLRSGFAGMLARALEAFRAEHAELLVIAPAGGAPGWAIAVGADQQVDLGGELRDEVADDLRALFGRNGGTRLVRACDAGPALGAHLRDHGVEEALVAALTADGGLLGALLVANPLEGRGAFGADDRRLFETLAGNAAATLGNERLEQRVAELNETQADLEHKAFHDALTGLANRLLFHDRVGHALSRRGGNAAVIYVDLNDFKPVNDTLGHDVGDELLKITADRLRESLRTADTPARLGGDEFAVLLTDIEPDHIRVVVERIIANFARPFDLAGRTHAITASIGIAMGDCGAITGEELLRNADAAMYVTKHGGKRGYTIHGSPMVPAAG